MLFKVSVVIAVATLAGAVNADDELFCNGSVDPAGCKDLGDLCGNPLIAGQCPVLCDSCEEAPAAPPQVDRRAISSQPEITVDDGNLYISAARGKDVLIEGGDGVQVDLLKIEPTIQAELKASVDSAAEIADERERKATQTTSELLEALATATTDSAAASKLASETLAAKMSTSIDSLTESADAFFTQFINITLEGTAGSSRRSVNAEAGDSDLAYATAYPHQVSDQGDHLIITFPVGTELIVNSDIKIYHCEWTDKNKVKKTSEMVGASTPRSLRVATPKWNAPGTLPSASSWDTTMVCFENGAKIAGPETDLVFKWVPSTPAFKKQTEVAKFAFSKTKTERGLKVDIELDYPYGTQGYEDCVVTIGTPFKAKDNGFVQRPAVGGDVKTSTRTISFDLKGQETDKEPIEIEIPIVVRSKKTGFKSSSVIVFHYEALSSFGGDQGNKDIMTPEAMEPLWIRMGRPIGKAMKLCYSSKRDGWATSTFHSRCDGQGRLFSVQRMRTGRVFGGYMHSSQEQPHTYRSCGYNNENTRVVTNSGWLFRVEPDDPKKITIYGHKRNSGNCYYKNPSYAMTWGGGHDLSCEQSFNHCYSNLGHNYGNAAKASIHRYGSSHNRNHIAGRYQWNGKNDMSDYEVYLVDKDP